MSDFADTVVRFARGQATSVELDSAVDSFKDSIIRAAYNNEPKPQEDEEFVEAFKNVTASLAAAISLLEAGGKAAKVGAASDKMFDIMISDYNKALERGRDVWRKYLS